MIPGLLAMALALCLPLQAEGEAPTVRPLPPTRLGLELLGQEPLVARVTTESATPFGMGTMIVRVRIEELISGRGPGVGESVVIFAYLGRYPTAGQALVYLLPFRDGGRYRLLEVVDGRDANWTAKLQLTRATVALTAIPSRQAQAAATFDLLARSLDAPNAWTRSYALRELQWMAAQQSWVITQARLRRLGAIAARSVHAEVPSGVESVAMTLQAATRALPPQDSEESSRS